MPYGPTILARTLSVRTRRDKGGTSWQYHSRSDHHSKVACWGILFDLLTASPVLRRYAAAGKVGFGINHEMRSFEIDRKKNLDLVICTPSSSGFELAGDFAGMVGDYGIVLAEDEREALATLPVLKRTPVGSVLIALEAKACMTAHQRALPRLYDELNSSHAIVHGASDSAIAAGYVIVNTAEDYLSPDLNKHPRLDRVWSRHKQPRDTVITVEKIRGLPRRTRHGETGYDALAITCLALRNDGTPVTIVDADPAPAPGEIYHYASMIDRMSQLFAYRFNDF